MSDYLEIKGSVLLDWLNDVVRNEESYFSALKKIHDSKIIICKKLDNDEVTVALLMLPLPNCERASQLEKIIIQAFMEGKTKDQILKDVDLFEMNCANCG